MIFTAGQNLFSQDIGNIYVNENISATLVFDEDIEFIVFGNNPVLGYDDGGMPVFGFYEMFQSSNAIILRLVNLDAPTTNLTIRMVNGEILHGMLRIDKEKATSFYDFRQREPENVKTEKHDLEKTRTDLVDFRVAQIIEMADEYTWLGARRSRMEYQVGNIRNDSRHMYLKITIRNNSGAQYNIDGAIFRFEEAKGRGIGRRGQQLTERVVPVYHSEVEYVGAYSEKTLGYALPLFSVGQNGKLVIQFIEKNGSRNATIEIPAAELLKVRIFPDKI